MDNWYGLIEGGRQARQRPDVHAQMRREAEILRAEQRAIRRGRPFPRTLRSVWQPRSTIAPLGGLDQERAA